MDFQMTELLSQFDVAIIGGGISGISIARHLKHMGLRSVILEKATQIGGKAETLCLNGNVIELGTCFVASDYDEIVDLAKEFDLQTEPLGDASAHAESMLGDVYSPQTLARLRNLRNLILMLPAMRRYISLRRAALARFDARIAGEDAALSVPTLEWIKRNGCARLEPIFVGVGDLYGYGPMKTIPALYGLRWITPGLLTTTLLRRGKRIQQGFGELAKKVAQGAEIRLSSPMMDARRSPDGSWTIKSPTETLRAGHIIVACAPIAPEIRAIFDSPRRKVLEKSVVSMPYMSAVVTAKNWFSVNRRAFLRPGDHLDRLMVARCDGPAPDGCRYYVCFVCPTQWDDSHIGNILRSAIAEDGGSFQQIVQIRRWFSYMTHVKAEGVADGGYACLEDRQGVDNVWLCNSVIAHENWRDLLRLSKNVAHAILDRAKFGSPMIAYTDGGR
jgi:hypothetical protein